MCFTSGYPGQKVFIFSFIFTKRKPRPSGETWVPKRAIFETVPTDLFGLFIALFLSQMENILYCKPVDLDDYYGLLGCDELSSIEQIVNEYRIRALACHPDKNTDNPRAVEDFQKLKEAKEVLCNESSRKNYDMWRRSGVTISFHDWQALNDSVKTSMHWAVRSKKEPMLEDSVHSEEADAHSVQRSSEIQSPNAVPFPSDNCHRRFRWTADSPSSLLRKFRNYEI